MALEIAYHYARPDAKSVPGDLISSEQRSLSGASAVSAVTPDGAEWIKLTATEKCRYRYGPAYGISPTAADTGASPVLLANEIVWLTARAGHKVAAIQAA